MPLSQKLTKWTTGGQPLVNFTFTEWIEGTGSVVFYAGTALDSTATEVDILKSLTFASYDIEHAYSAATLDQTFTLKTEKNYNLSPSTISRRITGKGIVELDFGVYGHASTSIFGYVIAKLIKWDGSTETVIGTGQTQTIENAGGASYKNERSTLILTMTDTQINKGDVIRLSLEGWLKNGSGSFGGRIAWGQDPENRDGTIFLAANDDVTTLKVSVPFETE